jgi:hypothetical protein
VFGGNEYNTDGGIGNEELRMENCEFQDRRRGAKHEAKSRAREWNGGERSWVSEICDVKSAIISGSIEETLAHV